jgi:hypothetical protein
VPANFARKASLGNEPEEEAIAPGSDTTATADARLSFLQITQLRAPHCRPPQKNGHFVILADSEMAV